MSTDLSEIKVTDRFSLKDRNFLVTGGARGIGFAVCKSIAQLGGGVAVIDVLPKPVEEFHTLADRYGVKASYHQADITDQKSLESAFNDAVKAAGQLHGGLTAAGICIDEPLIDANWENSRRVLDINVLGTFWATKLIAKHLVDTKTPGSIVMIASVSGQGIHTPVQAVTIYNASKAAVKGMVGPLSAELGVHGIRVNSISPGYIQSPMTAGLGETFPELVDWFRDAAPVGRLGVPQDLSPTVCHLLSDAGSFITGSDILITGGIHAGRLDHLRKQK